MASCGSGMHRLERRAWRKRGNASGPEPVVLGVVPMFHITGMLYSVLGSVYSGSTVVLMPRWDRELAGRLISQHRITHWVCIPTMIHRPVRQPQLQELRSVEPARHQRRRRGDAARGRAALLDEFGLTFAEGYGLTETAAPSHSNPPERAKLQCLGIRTSRSIHASSIRSRWRSCRSARSARSSPRPMVFTGYWRHPEATEAAFVEFDGRKFFRTGDLGRMDEEGYFFITDRLKRMINASGFKVWPAESSCCSTSIRRYRRRASSPARDAYRGETVKAVVVLRAEAKGKTSAEDIIACRASTWRPTRCPSSSSSSTCCRSRARARSCGGCCRTRRTRAEALVVAIQRSIQRAPSRTKRSLPAIAKALARAARPDARR